MRIVALSLLFQSILTLGCQSKAAKSETVAEPIQH